MKGIDLKKIKKVHFIGIGGIGVSAIARMMLLEGKEVSGSDHSVSSVTDELKKLGAKIYSSHKAENIDIDTDFVIYTIAVPKENPELKAAEKLSIPVMTYPEILGLISKDKYTIAVSGTHGKTTTTAMIANILIEAKKDPTVIVGSFLKEQKSNFIAGKSEFFVVEACEYRRSFLNLFPRILAITNIDDDHLDYYGDLKGVQKGFREFAEKLGPKDFLVCNPGDKTVKPILRDLTAQIVDYSDVEPDILSRLNLKIPGKHNIENAKVALKVGNILGIDLEITMKALNNFSGTWRRFEYKGKTANGALVYDDYGHHPTEVKATLSGAREFFGDKKITVVFQPHLYSRTKMLLSDFAEAFKDADNVIIAPIYAARESPDPSISSDTLAEKINLKSGKAVSLPDFKAIEKYLDKSLKQGDVLITMGAGDIAKVGEGLLSL